MTPRRRRRALHHHGRRQRRAAPTTIEPSLPDGACAIGGHAISLATAWIDLCGAVGTVCFVDCRRTYVGASVDSLRIAPSLAAHVIMSANGVTVSAIVDARNVELHPRRIEIIDHWFVPEWAHLSLARVPANARALPTSA